MAQEKNKKTPLPDKPIFEEKEPEQEPNGNPGTGQHQQDIPDERSKNKRGGNRPHSRDDINPEEVPTGDPKEYNDGEPVEEKSPKVNKGL
jgi:hypothetical protein